MVETMANKVSLRIKELVSLAEQALDTAQRNLTAGDLRAAVNSVQRMLDYLTEKGIAVEATE